jgi:seryl-tRNA synthetase
MTNKNNGESFKDWYYTGNKCDTRFDKMKYNNKFYACEETWNHQQKKIDALTESERDYNLALESYMKSCDEKQKKIDALEADLKTVKDKSFELHTKDRQQLKEANEVIEFYGKNVPENMPCRAREYKAKYKL